MRTLRSHPAASPPPPTPHPHAPTRQLPLVAGKTTVSVTVSTQGSDFDTVLTVYSGAALVKLRRIASNDDCNQASAYSCVTFRATPGVQYSLQIMGAYGEEGNAAVRAWLAPVKK